MHYLYFMLIASIFTCSCAPFGVVQEHTHNIITRKVWRFGKPWKAAKLKSCQIKVRCSLYIICAWSWFYLKNKGLYYPLDVCVDSLSRKEIEQVSCRSHTPSILLCCCSLTVGLKMFLKIWWPSTSKCFHPDQDCNSVATMISHVPRLCLVVKLLFTAILAILPNFQIFLLCSILYSVSDLG